MKQQGSFGIPPDHTVIKPGYEHFLKRAPAAQQPPAVAKEQPPAAQLLAAAFRKLKGGRR
jgi:hypothetical protein